MKESMYFQYIFICVARYICIYSTQEPYSQYDQCVQYLLNVSILGYVRSVRLLPLARTLPFKLTYRTKSTWCTPDTIFWEFCNFLNSNVRHPRRIRHFLCFLMTNDYANFDLDLLKRTQRRSPTIFNQKYMAGSVRHARLKRLVERTCNLVW